MIVFVGGMPRSGSTFAFNVVREVLRMRGGVYQEPTSDLLGAVDRAGEAAHVIVKGHKLTPPSVALARHGAFRAVITYRRIEDAMASWFAVFPELPEQVGWDTMRGWLDLYPAIRPVGLHVSYAAIDRWPWLTAWRIGRYLSRDVGPLEITRIVERFHKTAVKQRADALSASGANVENAGWTHYDKLEFFHRHHVSSLASVPAEQRLSAERLQQVRRTFAADRQAYPELG